MYICMSILPDVHLCRCIRPVHMCVLILCNTIQYPAAKVFVLSYQSHFHWADQPTASCNIMHADLHVCYMHACVHACPCVCTPYIHTYIHSVCVCVCIHVCMYVICMYMYVCI